MHADMSFPSELEPLMFFALDHGIESIKASGGPLTPFLLQARGKPIEMTRFVAETLEEGVQHARDTARASDDRVTAVVLVHDGYVTIDGERCDAVVAVIQAAGAPTSDVFAQRYRVTEDGVAEVGNPKHIAIGEPPLLETR
jgi:hypothetical protein